MCLESSGTPQVLFALIIDILNDGKCEIIYVLLRVLHSLSEVVFCENHPLRKIFGLLLSLKTLQLEELSFRASEYAIEHLETEIGPTHVSTLQYHQKYVELVYDWRDRTQGESALGTLLQKTSLCVRGKRSSNNRSSPDTCTLAAEREEIFSVCGNVQRNS